MLSTQSVILISLYSGCNNFIKENPLTNITYIKQINILVVQRVHRPGNLIFFVSWSTQSTPLQLLLQQRTISGCSQATPRKIEGCNQPVVSPIKGPVIEAYKHYHVYTKVSAQCVGCKQCNSRYVCSCKGYHLCPECYKTHISEQNDIRGYTHIYKK
ncbi:Hypothetical_protein [Hexamita inflata]|uniref:Hypothetical_protein n=1 Tax=Hexamita inflata TaxID=28002 RepID=A0AA86NV51_9EUKA|nr:Hypothetical protein HINF_LOCUS13029 [Hexamita inflata]